MEGVQMAAVDAAPLLALAGIDDPAFKVQMDPRQWPDLSGKLAAVFAQRGEDVGHRGIGLGRDFAPAGDLLSCVDKKVGKEAPPDRPAPAGFPRNASPEAPRRTRAATLCSNRRREVSP